MFGGLVIYFFLFFIFDGWVVFGGIGEVIGFFVFGVFNVYIVIKGFEFIKWLEILVVFLLLIVGIGFIWWVSDKVLVIEVLVIFVNCLEDVGFFSYFFVGLMVMVGFWVMLLLNIFDFSCYVKS